MMASHNLERIASGSVPGALGVRIVEKKNTDGGLRKGGGCHHSANNKIFQQLSKTEGTMPVTMSLDARVQEELTKCTCIYNSPKFEESGVFYETEDEIRNLKSMTLEKDRQKLKFKCITLHRPDDQAKTKILLINGRDHHVEMTQMMPLCLSKFAVEIDHDYAGSADEGIVANDMDSLLEQFLEYEKEATDEKTTSKSVFPTPVPSPGEQNASCINAIVIEEEGKVVVQECGSGLAPTPPLTPTETDAGISFVEPCSFGDNMVVENHVTIDNTMQVNSVKVESLGAGISCTGIDCVEMVMNDTGISNGVSNLDVTLSVKKDEDLIKKSKLPKQYRVSSEKGTKQSSRSCSKSPRQRSRSRSCSCSSRSRSRSRSESASSLKSRSRSRSRSKGRSQSQSGISSRSLPGSKSGSRPHSRSRSRSRPLSRSRSRLHSRSRSRSSKGQRAWSRSRSSSSEEEYERYERYKSERRTPSRRDDNRRRRRYSSCSDDEYDCYTYSKRRKFDSCLSRKNRKRSSDYENDDESWYSRRLDCKRFRSMDDIDEENIHERLKDLAEPVPYDIERERKINFLCGQQRAVGTHERRNVYVGGIPRETTETELYRRFERFGLIERITLHFREQGDSYAFIIFDDARDALRAVEQGNDDPNYCKLDICFGGRRKFVGGDYVDFDGNKCFLEENELNSGTRSPSPELDFDMLLNMAKRQNSKESS